MSRYILDWEPSLVDFGRGVYTVIGDIEKSRIRSSAETLSFSDRYRTPGVPLPMYRVMAIFIEYPLLAVLPSIAFLGLYRVTRRPFVVVVALAWLLYGIYEYAMHERILCSGECNIRVDLLAIYPALVVASGVALGLAAAGLRARLRRPGP